MTRHRSLDADRVVALPALRGPAIPGLPCDVDGFVAARQLALVEGGDV